MDNSKGPVAEPELKADAGALPTAFGAVLFCEAGGTASRRAWSRAGAVKRSHQRMESRKNHATIIVREVNKNSEYGNDRAS